MKIGFLAAMFFLSCGTCAAQEWREIKGEHFIVYFIQDEKFAKEVSDKAEEHYRRIASDLGYPRYKEFWSWDKRVKIFIHSDHASFLKATGQPGWAQGLADYRSKEIVSYVWSKDFLESLLPHEMAHLIFRDFVGFEGEVPLWLDEGVAQWEEESKRKEAKRMVKRLYQNGALLSLRDVMILDIRNIKDKDKGGANLVSTFYIEAVSLVGFLIEKYGSDSFAYFCRQLRDGKSLEEALKFAYPASIRSIDELEDRWKEYLKREGD